MVMKTFSSRLIIFRFLLSVLRRLRPQKYFIWSDALGSQWLTWYSTSHWVMKRVFVFPASDKKSAAKETRVEHRVQKDFYTWKDTSSVNTSKVVKAIMGIPKKYSFQSTSTSSMCPGEFNKTNSHGNLRACCRPNEFNFHITFNWFPINFHIFLSPRRRFFFHFICLPFCLHSRASLWCSRRFNVFKLFFLCLAIFSQLRQPKERTNRTNIYSVCHLYHPDVLASRDLQAGRLRTFMFTHWCTPCDALKRTAQSDEKSLSIKVNCWIN